MHLPPRPREREPLYASLYWSFDMVGHRPLRLREAPTLLNCHQANKATGQARSRHFGVACLVVSPNFG